VRYVGRHTGSVIRVQDVPVTIGAAAEKKTISKHSSLTQSYLVVPVATEQRELSTRRIRLLERRITQSTDGHRESAFLFQQLSVIIQRYNAVDVLGTFAHTTPEDEI